MIMSLFGAVAPGIKPAAAIAARLFRDPGAGFLLANLADTAAIASTANNGLAGASDGSVVGIALESSKWGGRQTVGDVLAAAPELADPNTQSLQGATGTKDASGWWAITATGNFAGVRQAVTITPGVTFQVTIQWSGNSSNRNLYIEGFGGGLTVSNAQSGQASIVGVSTQTAAYLVVFLNGSTVGNVANIRIASVKKVEGTPFTQSVASRRPVWRAGAGAPYLEFDGVDDALTSGLIPQAAGTVALAFRAPGGSGRLLSGGGSGKDVSIRLDASGCVVFGFNAGDVFTDPRDLRNAWHTAALTWGGGTVRAYVDGAVVSEQAVVAAQDGTGVGYALAAAAGGAASFARADISAVVARSVSSTAEEMAGLDVFMRRTFR